MSKLKLLVLIGALFSGGCATAPINFEADFDNYPYGAVIPHKYKTTSKAFSLENGIGVFIIEKGMHGASSDAKGRKERAELGVVVPRKHLIHQKFRLRLPSANRISTRFMISQIKMESKPSASPSIAVYVDSGGRVKCNAFIDSGQIQLVRSIKLPDGSIDDGNWHDVEMWLRFDKEDGYCRVDVDGITQIEEEGFRSIPVGAVIEKEKTRARIGPYRDAGGLIDTVRIEYDDWTITTTPMEDGNSVQSGGK